MAILEETQQVIAYSRELEQKSRELEATARELTRANAQLKELDRLKDDFLSTVSHELRTPLTSIRTFSEILSEPRGLSPEQAERYLAIIQSETAAADPPARHHPRPDPAGAGPGRLEHGRRSIRRRRWRTRWRRPAACSASAHGDARGRHRSRPSAWSMPTATG